MIAAMRGSRFRRRGTAAILSAVTFVAVAPPPAAAATPAAIQAYFKRAHAGCNVNTKLLGSGTVQGAPGTLQLVELMIEGCEGAGNSSSAELVGIYERGGSLAAASAPASLGTPESAAVKDGRVVVSTLSHGPRDPLCCPTVRKTARLVFSNGALVQER